MTHVPSIDPQRELELSRLRALLADLKRIPADKRADERADERETTIFAMIHDLAPPTYQWSTRDNEIAEDAIRVGIGGTSAEMLMAGLSYVGPSASIYWSARVTPKGWFEAGSEIGPWPVRDALARAHVLRERMGYERVVVIIAEAGIWRPEYGTLADQEGF